VPTPLIREASMADIDRVLQFWVRAGAHPSATDNPHDLARVVAVPQSTLLVAVAVDVDGSTGIVGSLIATFDGWRGNFYRLAVDPGHRRRGLARRLVGEGERWLSGAGATRLSALVEGDRPVAQAFWESVGFEHYEGMRRYSKNG